MSSDKDFDRLNAEEIESWFGRIREFLPKLPFQNELRNRNLRPNIIKRLLSQFLTDDERAKLFELPEGCRIREGAKILSPENLVIGRHCWIGENAILDASGGLEIGEHTSIGLSVFIWTHSSHLTNLALSNEMGSDLIQRKPTKIGDGCFIAGPSVVLPGVTVGSNVLVRPFSTVDSNIPDNSLVEPNGVRAEVFSEKKISRMIKKLGR